MGALLAVAGTLLQVLLRNPLADPTILGVSGGAAVGAMVGLLLAWPGWAVHAAALAGACAAAGALLALALRLHPGWNIHRVLLTGVAIGAACGAIVSLLLALAPPGRLHGMLFWLLGDLSGAEHPLAPWVAAVVVVAVSQVLAPRLDALALGTLKARSLGVAVGATQTVAFLAATVATVAAVLVAGSIGFVGLVVPHALRLAGFGDHRRLVPLAALAGGALLTAADTLARSVVAPLRVPGRRDHRARRRAGAARAAREESLMLAAEGLTLVVPGRTLVTGMDFRLAPGDCCAVLGKNGAGKTSLLLALAGLAAPAAGTVRLGDAPIASRPRREVARRVGILLQDETESFWGTTLDYALLGRFAHAPAAFGADPAGEAAARAALAEVDLAAHAGQPYRTLSGGERQRARLAQLIVQSPKPGSSTSRSRTSTSVTRRRRCGSRRGSPPPAAR